MSKMTIIAIGIENEINQTKPNNQPFHHLPNTSTGASIAEYIQYAMTNGQYL